MVAVHSDVDRDALHVALADESVEIGGARPSESYLNAQRIVDSAISVGANAIHPGYGFLSENSLLAELCEQESIEFIGPPSNSIRIMASKSTAASIAVKAGVPVLSGYRESSQNPVSMIDAARKIGFPVLLKSSAGGGGRGMRIVHREDQFEELLQSAKSEAKESFDDDSMIIEKYLERARHIEVQIAGDKHGNIVHLFDRECSAQRRYQKIIEEAPAPNIAENIRSQMYEAAIAVSKALDYHNVGTVEFLLDGDNFYFMEMNTRLQVEHPVTEQVTNTDLVEWQLRIAEGESIQSFSLLEQPVGHAVEVRLYAENPSKNFLPSPGKISYLSLPETTENIQIHTGVRQGDNVDRHYDPLIAKVVSCRPDRGSAVARMIDALNQVQIAGLDTNLEFLSNLLQHKTFGDGMIDVKFVENNLDELIPTNDSLPYEIAVLAALYLHSSAEETNRNREFGRNKNISSPWRLQDGWRMNSIRERIWNFESHGGVTSVAVQFGKNSLSVYCGFQPISCQNLDVQKDKIAASLNGVPCQISVIELDDYLVAFRNTERYELRTTGKITVANAPATRNGSLAAPLPGRVVRLLVEKGESIKAGQNLIVIEAMKMEHHISSPIDGIVSAVNFKEDDQVDEGAVCVIVEPVESLTTESSE